MKQTALDEKFIHALEKRFNKRSALVFQISDILKIERDSANRRLSGKVQFSIREMGILARKLGVSVDGLIYDDTPSCSELLIMESPGCPILSEKKALEEITSYSNVWKKVSKQSYSEAGTVISSLPIQLYIHYPLLMRFTYFKWAHYILNFKEGFEGYQIPSGLAAKIQIFKESLSAMSYSYYIWSPSFLLGIVNDIKYFQNIELLKTEEVQAIKSELYNMLSTLEKSFMTNENTPFENNRKAEHYVSSVDTEVSASYIWSEEYYHSCIFTFFMYSATFLDQVKCSKIRNWIHSMKKVSTLISGSGEMARINFFKQQYQYMDSVK